MQILCKGVGILNELYDMQKAVKSRTTWLPNKFNKQQFNFPWICIVQVVI